MSEKFRRHTAASLILLVISLSIAFGLAEIVVRVFSAQPFHPGRRLFLSDAQFDLTGNGAVRYLPLDTIRMVAIYDGEVEFDVTFDTNNYGLVDTEDYPLAGQSEKRAYAIVGNSFAAGVHGGHPWVPRLRDTASRRGHPTMLYNLGVEGTGFWHFSKLLEFVQEDLAFDAVVVIGISDDFRRPYWTPIVEGSAVHMCLSEEIREECVRREPYASLFDMGMDQDGILQLAKQSAGTALLLKNPSRFLAMQAKNSMFLVLLVREIKNALNFRNTPSFGGFRALAASQHGREIYLLHVPQSHEVVSNRYDIDPANVANELGVIYVPLLETCKWDRTMFYERDAHPNERGYQNLGLCVGAVLGLTP